MAKGAPANIMLMGSATAVERWLVGNPVRMWLFALLAGGAIHLLLWQISEPYELFSDFYKANFPAAESVLEDGLAATVPLTEKGGFSNLPALAWLFVPFVLIGEEQAAWAFIALGYVALFASWALLARLARLDATLSALLLFVFLVNGPIVNSLREGQTSHALLVFIVLTLVFWQAGREFLAGVCMGVCAVFKLPLLLFGLYFVLRQRWGVVAGGATTIGSVVLVSVALFDIEGLAAWYNEWVTPFIGSAIPAFNVQSINGFLVRLTMDATHVRDWEPHQPALPIKLVRTLAMVSMFAVSAWLIWRAAANAPPDAQGRRASPRDFLEFVLVLTLALVVSPLSWTHYYVFLLLPWALYVGGMLPIPDDGVTRWLMHGGMVLVSLPVVALAPEQATWWATLLTRTVVSAWLYGGLMMFAALARGLWHATRPGATGAAIRTP